MAIDELHTYLNDHLAGSVVAIKVLDRLIDTSDADEERRFFATLKEENEQDQTTLAGLLERAGGPQSPVRQLGARLSEVMTTVKLRLDDPSGRRLNYLEALEGLALGIHGKKALWRLLGTLVDRIPRLGGVDFELLARRAQEQHDRVDARRLETARRLFAPTSPATASG